MRSNKSRFVLATLAVLLASSSLFAKKDPDWILGNSAKYPEPQFFIGVGSVSLAKGGEKQQHQWAGDQARGEIAKILKTEVSVATQVERSVKSDSVGGKKRTQTDATQTDVVSANASEVLEGVEIREYFIDKKGGKLYALAVLDRVKAARRLESRLEESKRGVLAEMEAGQQLAQEKQLLSAIGHYRKGLTLAEALPFLRDQISVLSPSRFGGEAETTGESAEIKKIIRELRKKIRFNVEVTGPAEGVKIYLVQGLSREGLLTDKEAAPEASSQIYKLVGKTDVTPKGSMSMGSFDVQVYQADLDLEVKDPESGETLAGLTWSVNANEKSSELAAKSAIRTLGRIVQEQIGKKLMEGF